MSSCDVSGMKPVCVDPDEESGSEPFIADAVVSLVGSDKRVLIELLGNKGVKWPFSLETETGDFILMKGMELGLIPVS